MTARSDCATSASGGATPSSTSSTCAASPTATATASAISPACARGSATSATSASTPSGSTRGTCRRWPTAATTSPTTGHRAAVRHARRGRGAHRRGARRSASARSSTSSPTTCPTAPVVRRGARRRSRLADARPLLVPARAGAPAAASRRTAGVALRRLGVDPHEEPRRHARRLVPAPVRAGPARPQLGPPRRPRASTRTSCASGSTAAPAGVRIDSAALAIKDPDAPRARPTDRRPASHPFVDRDELHDSTASWRAHRRRLRPAARAHRRGVAGGPRALRPLPAPRRAARRVQLRLPRLPVGRRRAAARASTTRSAATRRSAPRRRGCSSNHDVTRVVTRYGRADTSFSFAAKRIGTPTDLALGDAPGPRRGRCSPPRCPARSTCTRARSSACPRSRTCPPTASRTRCTSSPAASTPGATAAGCRCRGSGDAPPFGFSPPARREPWLPQPADWADAHGRRPARRPELDARRSTARVDRRCAGERLGGDADRRSSGCRARRTSWRSARGDVACVVNLVRRPASSCRRRRDPRRQRRRWPTAACRPTPPCGSQLDDARRPTTSDAPTGHQ